MSQSQSPKAPAAVAPVEVVRVPDGDPSDRVAVEEPLEIQLLPHDGQAEPVAVTMRTPGNDRELAAGFLFSEGLIGESQEIAAQDAVGEPAPGTGLRNTLRVTLAEGVAVDPGRLQRHFYATSSCGVCGKRSLEALAIQQRFDPRESRFSVSAAVLHGLPDQLRAAQSVFEDTGALHAAARFDAHGELHALYEDVGRHNALDKLIGSALMANELPLRDQGILVSGRASFELLQKTLMAGCPLIAAVGGPSSLAVELAREYGITLVGFLRDGRFNIYAGRERVR